MCVTRAPIPLSPFFDLGARGSFSFFIPPPPLHFHLLCFVFFSPHSLLLHLTDPTDQFKITDQTRRLGLVVCRGTHVSLISPSDGMEEIANPFEDEEEAGGDT